jgi:hypothetical protein
MAVASDTTTGYVAVGDTGKLATSPDGTTWTQRTSSFGTTIINGVAWGDGYWVAVGNSAKVAYSTDGITWTQVTTGITGDVQTVSWGNGLWIITAASGQLYTATNPTGTWTSRTSTFTGTPVPLYFKGQSIWVAGGDTGTTGAMASSTDGITWTARTSAITITSAGKLTANTTVAIYAPATGVLTFDIESTANGTTWTDRTPAITSGIPYAAASDSNGLMILQGGGLQSSSDGITWTSRTQPDPNTLCLCHSSGMPSNR